MGFVKSWSAEETKVQKAKQEIDQFSQALAEKTEEQKTQALRLQRDAEAKLQSLPCFPNIDTGIIDKFCQIDFVSCANVTSTLLNGKVYLNEAWATIKRVNHTYYNLVKCDITENPSSLYYCALNGANSFLDSLLINRPEIDNVTQDIQQTMDVIDSSFEKCIGKTNETVDYCYDTVIALPECKSVQLQTIL